MIDSFGIVKKRMSITKRSSLAQDCNVLFISWLDHQRIHHIKENSTWSKWELEKWSSTLLLISDLTPQLVASAMQGFRAQAIARFQI